MILAILPKRGTDDWGSGEFGASRGSRLHNGRDYACYEFTVICSLTDGIVTKLGYPYGDDLSYRYVEITDNEGFRHRYFYVSPSVEVGEQCRRGDMIGLSQNISKRYNDPKKGPMKNHMHYEIMNGSRYIDPEVYHG